MKKKADTSLSYSEKEDREIERLIDKKPAPSRKNREKRGPKFDNRRRVMQVEKDPDLDKSDPDLSRSGSDKYSFDYSYGADMSIRTSKYHGIVEKYNQDSYEESRASASVFDPICEDDHKKISKEAKKLLKEEWFKAGWGDDKSDAATRAALDISISTVCGGIYANRIDSLTYNMLLGGLLGSEVDSNVASFFDDGAGLTRREFKMDKDSILHLASKVRHSDPRLALDLIRSVRTAAEPMPGAMDDKMKSHMDKKLKELLDAISDEDVDQFGKKMKEISQLLPKTASRTAADFFEFKSLADMSAKDLSDFFEKSRKEVEKAKKQLDSDDIEDFMISFTSLADSAQDAAKKAKVGSVTVRISSLIEAASKSDEVRQILLPYLAAAKKKLDKKAPKKTSTEKAEEPKKSEKAADPKKDEKAEKTAGPKKGK